ncbi:MAG: phage tail length tape measure family protein [Phycisphaerae bacterium]|jgi:hypothetical protein
MASEVEEVLIRIRADVNQATNEIKKIQSSLASTEKSAKSFGAGFLSMAKGFVGLAAAGAAIKFIAQETIAAEKAQAQLNAVLTSTKHAAGLSAEEINNMAENMSKLTAIDDEAIISGQSLLLTFTKIGGDVFPRATEAMLDMSVALGQDVKGSAIQLGKALQDPIQGVTALRRVGVQLSEAQEKQIKQFVAINDLASAQKIILEELERQVGGSARAYANTLGGQIDHLKNAFGNLAAEIGRSFSGVFTSILNGAASLIGGLAGMLKSLNDRQEKFYNQGFETAQKYQAAGVKGWKYWKDAKAGTESWQYMDQSAVTRPIQKSGAGKDGQSPASAGGMEQYYAQQKKAAQDYYIYIGDMNSSLRAKENERYTSALASYTQYGGTREEVEQQHQENLLLIEEEANQRRFESVQKVYGMLSGMAQTAASGIQQIFQMQAQNEQTTLRNKFGLFNLLANTFIKDEAKREKALENIRKIQEIFEMQLARRQFERNKAMQIASIWMNAGAAIMGAWGSAMMPQSNGGVYYLGIALAAAGTALITAMAGAQTSLVASQHYSAMAEGGLIQGTQGGTHILAGEGGRSEAIIPLENPEAMSKLGGMGVTYNISLDGSFLADQDIPERVAEAIDRALYKLDRRRNSVFAAALR